MWLNAKQAEEFLQIYCQIPVVLFAVDPFAGGFMEDGTRYRFMNQFAKMERMDEVLVVGQYHYRYLNFL